ncbi:hypothetical protein ACJRO7_032017 [Eucalyptus globulus]|uniref:Uncharacterized protein n=1 Tax=Eucalyptus globulus TaxID=34317 RepID=A0ABD3JGH8_EUCGL
MLRKQHTETKPRMIYSCSILTTKYTGLKIAGSLSAPSPSPSVNGTSIPSDAADIAVPASPLALATSSSSKLLINQLTRLLCSQPSWVFRRATFLKHTSFI